MIDAGTRVDCLRTGKIGIWTWQRNWMPGKCWAYIDTRNVMQYAWGQCWPMFSFAIVENEWRAITEEERNYWKTKAGKMGPWGKNLFMKKYWEDNREDVEEGGKALAMLPSAISMGGKKGRCKTILQKT